MSSCVKIVESDSERLTAICLEGSDGKYLFINVYMPCDPRLLNIESSPVYSEVLNAIDVCIDRSKPDFILIGGDFNTDFSRRSVHTKLLQDFMREGTLVDCCDALRKNVSYTFRDSRNQTSLIDHYLVSENMVPILGDVQIIDEGDNLSAHLPL